MRFVDVTGVAEEVRRVNLVSLPDRGTPPSAALVNALRGRAAALAG
ncbi:LysR family transcriptional regulator [Streptomyces sp. KO7888]|nr:LysR family transcriptional regulator [Streptomyces sp. KO7888]